MNIIYKNKDTENQLHFKDCETNQFFVHCACLFQKVGAYEANQITNQQGLPYADQAEFEQYDVIERLIPLVDKIEY
jgi:hypothetical protein